MKITVESRIMCMRHTACVCGGIAVLFLASSAKADVADFKKKAEFSLDGEPVCVDVSIDDRFVFAADRAHHRMAVIDTWNWHVMTPLEGNTISGDAVDMAVSPGGDYVYVSRSDGWISQLDVSGLKDLGFNKRLDSLDPPITENEIEISEGHILGDIQVIPQQGNAGVDCVLVVDETSEKLQWFLSDGTNVDPGAGPLITGASEIELSAGKDVIFARYKFAMTGNNWLDIYKCINQTPIIIIINNYDILGSNDPYALSGLDLDPLEFRLAMGDVNNKNLYLFDVSNFWSISLYPNDSISIPSSPSEVLFSDFSFEPDPVVWALEGDTLLSGAVVNDDLVEFTGDYGPAVAFSSTVTALVQSSTVDGYIYAALEGSPAVPVVTANPWISDLSTDPSGTISASLFNLEFNYDLGTNYTVRKVEYFKDAGTIVAEGVLSESGTYASIQISTPDLDEGYNILAIEVADSAVHTGRHALSVQVDMPLEPLDFDLDFGDERLFVNFKSHDSSDLDYYRIYYGTNGGVPESDYEKLDDTGKMGEPPSPFEISDPDPDKDYEEVIEELENGVEYFMQIISVDDAGHITISERKSAMPQNTIYLTDAAGEDGGFDCSWQIGSASHEGPPWGWLIQLWPLVLPGLFAGMFKLRRRLRER
jgi:hypothetical protein